MFQKLSLILCIFLLSSATTCANPNARTLVFNVVSDTNNNASGLALLTGGPAVLATTVGGWKASVPGASWIWSNATVFNPAVSEISYFVNEFHIPGIPINGVLLAAGDNTVVTLINNFPISCPISNTWNSAVSCNVATYLLPGMNLIQFTVTNVGNAGATNPLSNPAGILYKLTITANLI